MLEAFLQTNIWVFVVVMTRIGTMLGTLPGFAAGYVLPRYRISLALLLSFLLAPMVVQFVPPLPESAMMMFLILAGEVVVGAFLASIAVVMFAALQAAGTFIAFFSSMANALVQDAVANQQSSVIAGFLSTMGLVLIFVTDLHHIMLRAGVDSFELMRPGQPLLLGDMSDMIATRVAEAFALGLKLSSPLLISAMIYYLALGVLGRLMPTLQVFFFGLPLQISAQLFVLALSVSGMMIVFLQAFSDAYTPFLAP
jgi:flagellar biosynthetic protein FliR